VVAGVPSIVGAYVIARELEDPDKAGANAALELLVLVIVGVFLTRVVDERAAEHERQRRAQTRRRLVGMLGPNLIQAADGWIHRPAESARGREDLDAGIARLEDAVGQLQATENRLGAQREHTREDDPTRSAYLTHVWGSVAEYWNEGVRPARLRHLVSLHDLLEPLIPDDGGLREGFVDFGGNLARADGARLSTDNLITQHLVGELSGGLPSSLKTPLGPEISEILQSVAADAGSRDAVYQLSLAANRLMKRSLAGGLTERWGAEVDTTLQRPIGALEQEVANVRLSLDALARLALALKADAESK
jgi:hypothetical protein